MKKFIFPTVIGSLLLLSSAGISHAQTTAELELVNPNYFSPAITDSGVYAGPYSASTVTNGNVSPTTFPIICDNYDTDVSVGLTWMAEGVTLSQEFSTPPSVTPPLKLEGSTNLSNLASYDEGTPVTAEGAYEAAAWMAQQIMSIGSTDPNSLSSSQATEIANYNWAIWAIFSSGATGNTSGFNAGAKTDLETASEIFPTIPCPSSTM